MGKKSPSHHPSPKSGEALEYDHQIEGPIKNRGCTDIICLMLFAVFIIAWIVLAGFVYKNGNPQRLILPTDSQGNICGQGDFADRKHLFFFDITKCAALKKSLKFVCRTPQVCVEKCPSETLVIKTDITKDKLICKYNVDKDGKSVKKLMEDGDCANYYLKSFSVGGRCMPDLASLKDISNFENMTKAAKGLQKFVKAQEIGEMIFQDLEVSWKWILIGLAIAMVVSFIWILLMRWLAGIMVWLSIFLLLGLLGFGCYYSTSKYLKLRSQAAKPENEFIDIDSFLANKNTWLGFAIIAGVVFAILLLVLIFLRKRIVISIALIREASKAVGCMMSSLFFPLLIYVIQIVFLLFWGSVALYLSTAREPVFQVVNAEELPKSEYEDGNDCTPEDFRIKGLPAQNCMFIKYKENPYLDYAQLYNLFGFFWGMFFAVGIGQVSLAGAFASYYWARDKPKDVPTFAVIGGFARCLRYHLGSVAFGSLLLATVRMIRFLIEYTEKKLKKFSDNIIAKCLFCCCRCFFWCLEKFLKFINKNAYIMIAIYGKNFCASARHAFKLLMRNIVRVVVLDKVTDFLLFIGKLVVVALMGVASFYFFKDGSENATVTEHVDIPKLNYIWLPVTLICFGAYVIASLFFSVYSMAVDTLFLCFLEDCERNDGSASKPYYMSKKLMKIIGKKNKLSDPEQQSPAK